MAKKVNNFRRNAQNKWQFPGEISKQSISFGKSSFDRKSQFILVYACKTMSKLKEWEPFPGKNRKFP